MYKLSGRSLERLQGIDPRLIELIQKAIERSPIDFGVPRDGGVRTAQRQYELYSRKLSKCDGAVIKSNHQSGNAFDIYAYVNDKASWDEVHLAMVAGVILSTAKEMGLNVVWGGSFGSGEFKGWDKPHFELKK